MCSVLGGWENMALFPFVFIDLGGWKTILSHVKRSRSNRWMSPESADVVCPRPWARVMTWPLPWRRRESNVPGAAEADARSAKPIQEDLPTSLSPAQPASQLSLIRIITLESTTLHRVERLRVAAPWAVIRRRAEADADKWARQKRPLRRLGPPLFCRRHD